MPPHSLSFAGTSYPLTHLVSFQVVVPAKDPLAAAATLQVTFSDHVYSQKFDPAVHDEALRLPGSPERAFCPVRYGCSIDLPRLVQYHVGGKAFEGRDSKGARNHFLYAEADAISYPIYFRLGRADRIPEVAGVMHIISAYQNPDLKARNRFQAVKFARLVHTTCVG